MRTLTGHLESARRQGRAHEQGEPGHTVTEMESSTHDEKAITLVCDSCEWYFAAGGKREPEAKPISLAEFLLARFGEDEQVARAVEAQAPRAVVARTALVDLLNGAEFMHSSAIAFPTARVLAECEAKRRIIAWVTDDTAVCEVADPVLRALALPYADHPDYRPEWRS